MTDADLFIPVLTFVYGEAQLGGRAAVVSTARLAVEQGRHDPALVAERIVKECVHELGHTFGLLHCDTPGCVMTPVGQPHRGRREGRGALRTMRSPVP